MHADSSVDPRAVTLAPDESAEARRFDDWYRRDYRRVVGLVFSLTGSLGAAEELTQDAFIEAHRRWDEISRYDDPGAWVRKVALNRARSRFRRTAAEARAYTRVMGRRRPETVDLPESSDAFWAAVRTLPAQQAHVVALHYLDDLPIDGIAAVLDIAPGTVKSHLHRARTALAERLTREDLQ